jgi:hypothetical protein
MFSAILRQLAHHKARIPWLKDLHLNFILLHYTYIISISLISSIIIYPGNDLKYIDALFFAVGAATQSGLNTVDFNKLFTYQQVILYFISMLTTPIFIHTALLVRKAIPARRPRRSRPSHHQIPTPNHQRG